MILTEGESSQAYSHRTMPVLGAAYHARSQEALACYQAHAFLAWCAMCGAAAEAILLRLIIAKSGEEEEVYRAYRRASRRSRIENILSGQLNERLRR
jgi:hypothetical protein